MVVPFRIGRLPEIVFGEGTCMQVPDFAASFGRRMVLVTGARSLRESRHWPALADALVSRRLVWVAVEVKGEPTPESVDDVVREHHGGDIHSVVAIGGGSVLDAGKAIAALLPSGRSVLDHLEEVGRSVPFTGPTTPFIAVPTTAGTGSEATKNSVLSEVGDSGFKKSFRHDSLVARYAVVDPLLLETCPRDLIAADGLDALTQLLESYVSPRASPLTDALAESGIAAVREGLIAWHEGSGGGASRSRMAYAALLSGITLAQTGLGAVHGLASPLGAFFPIPHGIVCGTLVAAATQCNVDALRERAPAHPALDRYARAHAILTGQVNGTPEGLVALLRDWTVRLSLPALGSYGVGPANAARIIAASRGGSMKTNPIVLTDDELAGILDARM